MYIDSRFACPFCGSRLYQSSRGGRQVYKCNDLTEEGCPNGREAVAGTKPQVWRVVQEVG